MPGIVCGRSLLALPKAWLYEMRKGKDVVHLCHSLGSSGPCSVRHRLLHVHVGRVHGCASPNWKQSFSLVFLILPLSHFSPRVYPLLSLLGGSSQCPSGRHCFAACSSSELPSLSPWGLTTAHCTGALGCQSPWAMMAISHVCPVLVGRSRAAINLKEETVSSLLNVPTGTLQFVWLRLPKDAHTCGHAARGCRGLRRSCIAHLQYGNRCLKLDTLDCDLCFFERVLEEWR